MKTFLTTMLDDSGLTLTQAQVRRTQATYTLDYGTDDRAYRERSRDAMTILNNLRFRCHAGLFDVRLPKVRASFERYSISKSDLHPVLPFELWTAVEIGDPSLDLAVLAWYHRFVRASATIEEVRAVVTKRRSDLEALAGWESTGIRWATVILKDLDDLTDEYCELLPPDWFTTPPSTAFVLRALGSPSEIARWAADKWWDARKVGMPKPAAPEHEFVRLDLKRSGRTRPC